MTKILLIEDETTLRHDLGEWLTFEGYTVFSAEDGVAGLEYAFRELVWSNKCIHGEFEPDLCCDLLLEFKIL